MLRGNGGEEPIEWQIEVGVLVEWRSPPWSAVLGQRGFFDQFTVVMSALAGGLATCPRDEFDHRFGVPPAGPPGPPARFRP